ncbi:MAG: diguanylate cyclase [Candidatus Omnitrophica bacterium]|nr:diguanylate cyclase [Candidatus Omnitrophota bacterium]
MIKKNIFSIGLDKQTIESLYAYFAEDFDFIIIETAEELMSKIKKHKASLMFLNNRLSDFDNCQELCIVLRSRPDTETVPLIILTNDPSELHQKEKISLFQAGLIDGYFSMPLNAEELAAYSNVFLQRQSLQEQLEETNKLLSTISITDELMRIYNRRYLMHRLEDELTRIKRYNYPLSAIMIDLDYFKKINDQHGHIQGDKALRGLAVFLKQNIRSMDILCRYGGEEIVILLPHTSNKGASLTAERIRSRVKAHNFGDTDNPLRFTISIGLVTFDGQNELTVDKVIHALDAQLYKAKNSGRDKVCETLYEDTLKPDA